jgi:hypothetical protein
VGAFWPWPSRSWPSPSCTNGIRFLQLLHFCTSACHAPALAHALSLFMHKSCLISLRGWRKHPLRSQHISALLHPFSSGTQAQSPLPRAQLPLAQRVRCTWHAEQHVVSASSALYLCSWAKKPKEKFAPLDCCIHALRGLCRVEALALLQETDHAPVCLADGCKDLASLNHPAWKGLPYLVEPEARMLLLPSPRTGGCGAPQPLHLGARLVKLCLEERE